MPPAPPSKSAMKARANSVGSTAGSSASLPCAISKRADSQAQQQLTTDRTCASHVVHPALRHNLRDLAIHSNRMQDRDPMRNQTVLIGFALETLPEVRMCD